jgi:hypothetical protein
MARPIRRAAPVTNAVPGVSTTVRISGSIHRVQDEATLCQSEVASRKCLQRHYGLIWILRAAGHWMRQPNSICAS